MKRYTSKSILLTALITSSVASFVALAQTNAANSVTLELFNAKPSESSQATASLEIGTAGGNLQSIETPEQAKKARYLRAKVSSATGVENYLYRVIGNPDNGRIFIITPERKAMALNKFLTSTGLEVGADKTVKLGSQVDFASKNASVPDSDSSASQVAGSMTEASATSTTASTTPVETSTPAATTPATTTATDLSATPAADASKTATAPANSSTTSSTPATTTEASTTPATTTPATTTTPDANATPAGSSATQATDASATPATDASTTPAMTTSSATTNSTPSTEAAALTAPVSTTLGKVELTVIPAGAKAPASSEKNLILAPIANATEAKSSVDGNTAILSYTSSSSIEEVSIFYDDQFIAQGFTHDAADAANQTGADQFVKVYKRGSATMTMIVRAENGGYMIEVDLEKLASGT
jgi:hypothetical protein